ncbi:hypothetical protein [Methylocucumis oryzae]|nr:hypothetical protein [Methylocucumis oryzae]
MNTLNEFLNAEKNGDFSVLINTEKGAFTVSEIWSMLLHQHRKTHDRKTKMPAPTIGAFNKAIRKLKKKELIIAEHEKSIAEIVKNNFSDSKVIYVSNYDDSSDGPSVFDTSYDGSHKIKVADFTYVNVNYKTFQKIDDYYFFPVLDACDYYLVFDKKGFDYLLWSNLNHEQRTAKQFIEYIGESIESLALKTRYQLSDFFEKILLGDYGTVTFTNISEDNNHAEAAIETKNGMFVCKAYFSGFERKDVMKRILAS